MTILTFWFGTFATIVWNLNEVSLS